MRSEIENWRTRNNSDPPDSHSTIYWRYWIRGKIIKESSFGVIYYEIIIFMKIVFMANI
jgi:hypothetical protein